MDTVLMTIPGHASIPAQHFNPYDRPKPSLPPYDAYSARRDAKLPTPIPASAHNAPSPAPSHPCTTFVRANAALTVVSSEQPASHASQDSPPAVPKKGGASYREDHNNSSVVDVQSPSSPAPPPVPPKSPIQDRPKSVSIVEPTDISPARGISSHSYRTTVNSAATSPAGAPTDRTVITSPYVSSPALADDSSSSSNTPHVRPSMEPATRKASSVRARRNKLHKPRQHSLPSLPLGTSLFGSLLSRAFGSHPSTPGHSRSSSVPSMSDRSYRPARSVSDGGHVGTKRPAPSSRSSDVTDSSCTTSSSASTAVSSASTALTTPDSTSPSLSPHSSTRSVRTNKLHKRRPPSSPSAGYQYPLGAHAAALGRSKSTPTGLGQRVERSRNWSSVEEARHAAEEAESLRYGPGPTAWLTTSTDLSPSRRSTLDPILEVRKKSSSHALAELACTGLCSSSVAALSSQLALEAEISDRLSALNDQSWYDQGAGQFNPYLECVSPAELEKSSGDITTTAQADSSSVSSPSPAQSDSPTNDEGSPSGFAVVRGSLDRSEDAMRRWTLAMADVPDEVLVQHLERLRKESMALARGRLPGRRSTAPSQVGHGDEESTVDTRERPTSFFFGGPREMGISPRSPSSARFSVGHYDRELEGDESDDEALSDEDDEEDWKTARQVLFCCRELVQTERNYQARLREFVTTELSSHYASLVARHIPALLSVSETLLTHLVDDPSAWGVSAAFIGCEEELEAAFVAWSAVVGEFFVEDASLKPSRKLTRKPVDDAHSNLGHDTPTSSLRLTMRTRSHTGMAPTKRDSLVAGRRFSSAMSDIGHGETASTIGHGSGMFTAALGTGLAFGLSVPSSPAPFDPDFSPKPSQARSLHGHGNRANASTLSGLGLTRAVSAVNAWKRKSMPSSLSHLPSLVGSPATTPNSPAQTHSHHHHSHHHHHHSSSASAHGHGKKQSEHDAKMTVRDLAIQPTQRVMRYVLQYRDLLDHTPTTSPSRALVERAYETALRIAKKCDRAQAHAAFFRQQQHQK
ncbi:hypothetical protein PYCCODRAFT_1423085 [Trametes coccinea BRFM310]|uniref:DH domain-containing protein n=1 Tax=Trametes coccinea (strain BRFM310) TaxID=1353009 RepID=A0A1Y2J1A4_TRAC3|nr:hypothetical protein PYCCODRAFT_1423085 [Trametes coccinea BRFM310]